VRLCCGGVGEGEGECREAGFGRDAREVLCRRKVGRRSSLKKEKERGSEDEG